MATPLQYSCLETPRTEEPGGLQSLGSQSWPLLNSHKGSCALAWGWVEGGLDTAERPGHPVQLPGSLVKLGSCLEDNLPCDEQAGSILEDTPRMAQSLRGSLNPGSHPDKPGCEAQAPDSQPAHPRWVTLLLAQNSSGSKMDNLGTALASESTAL